MVAVIDASYQCIMPSCSTQYSLNRILTACEKCGNPVDIKYDMDADTLSNILSTNLGIRRNITDKKIKDGLRERMSDLDNIFNISGVWRFRELLPFFGDTSNYENSSKVLASLDGSEGRTFPIALSVVGKYVGLQNGNCYGQFEGWNRTGSFKDNGMATATTHLKMLNLLYDFNIKTITCASTGNTSASAAAYGINELLKVIIFTGEGKVPIGKLAQALLYGAKVMQIDGGNFDDAMKVIKEVAPNIGLYPVNSINPFRHEGQKTIVHRVIEAFNWDPPDVIAVPGGNLGNTSAFGKSLQELYDWGLIDKIPMLLIVNAEGANTFSTLVNRENMTWNDGNPDLHIRDKFFIYLDQNEIKPETKASAIEIAKPENLLKALRSIEYTKGSVLEVSDDEIFEAQRKIGENAYGCEPSSAATFAGVKKAIEKGIIDPGQKVVGILTGHELKDPQTIINNYQDQIHNVSSNLEDIMEAVRLAV